MRARTCSHGTHSAKPIYLVTSADQPDLCEDDRLLLSALREHDLPVRVVVWDDPGVDWSCATVAMIRSAWDYHLKPDHFRDWLDQVSTATTLVNAPELVRWNMHKRYLRELSSQGIPTIDTVWLTPGTSPDLTRILAENGWAQALLKPAISASAWNTMKFEADDATARDLAHEILRSTDAMIQPYLSSIEREGEIAVVAINGAITHAARRVSALTGDISETRCGGPHTMSADEGQLAKSVLSLLPEVPTYARIDVVRDDAGHVLLGELELIEPVIYLRHGPEAIAELVRSFRTILQLANR